MGLSRVENVRAAAHPPVGFQFCTYKFYRLTNNIDAMHRGCTFLIRKVQDTSARLTDVRPSTQVA